MIFPPPQLMCFTMHVSKTKLTFKALNYQAKHRITSCTQFKKTQALPWKHDVFFTHKNSHANFTDLVQMPMCIYYVEIVLYDIFQHILYILSRLQKHHNKYKFFTSLQNIRFFYYGLLSTLLVPSMHIQLLALRKAGAILFYNSSTSTSKKGKERYEYKIITKKKKNYWNTLFSMNLNQLSRKCVI